MADEQNTPLQALQARFALVRLEGTWFVVDRDAIAAIAQGLRPDAAGIDFFKKQDADLLLRRHLESLPMACSNVNPVLRSFFDSHNTHVYNRIAFSPHDEGPQTINYWSPPTVRPESGDWSIIREYLENVLCGGDHDAADYLLHYIAHMLQRPGDKPGVMIVFLGPQGTGKGMFFNLLQAIWGRTTLRVSSVVQIVGQFNAALERAYVVCMDEALFKGDKQSTEKLKSIITEPLLHVEQKYQPSHTIKSVHRFFAVSNNAHFANIDPDDRRMFYVRVGNDRAQDLQYFAGLDNAIHDPAVVGAMVHDLIALDLRGFQVRRRPKTAELARQKLLSLAGFDRYWFEVLGAGRFRRQNFLDDEWGDRPTFVSSESLIEGWRENDRNGTRYDAPQINDLPTKLLRLCPSAKKARATLPGRGQHRGFSVPALAVARQEFETFIGAQVFWEHAIDGDEARLAPDRDPDAAPDPEGDAASVAEAVFAKIRQEIGVGVERPVAPAREGERG